MGAKWVDHKGRRVLYVDCRGLEGKEFVAVLHEGAEMMRKSPNKVLYLVNMEGAFLSREIMDWFRQEGTEQARKKGEKYAVVGSTGVQKVAVDSAFSLFRRIGSNGRAFKTDREALDWLVE